MAFILLSVLSLFCFSIYESMEDPTKAAKAYNLGRESFSRGANRFDNPFDTSSDYWDDWLDGWKSKQEEAIFAESEGKE